MFRYHTHTNVLVISFAVSREKHLWSFRLSIYLKKNAFESQANVKIDNTQSGHIATILLLAEIDYTFSTNPLNEEYWMINLHIMCQSDPTQYANPNDNTLLLYLVFRDSLDFNFVLIICIGIFTVCFRYFHAGSRHKSRRKRFTIALPML